MSYLAKASSLKRQPNTLLTYFPKKSPCADSRDAATTPQCQIPVVEEPVTDQISSSDESIGQQVLTDDASFDEPAHPNDLGIYAGKSVSVAIMQFTHDVRIVRVLH